MLSIFGHVGKRLDKKARGNFKIYDDTNISRSKDNQTMKFGQLIEYNMRNIFLKNYAQNVLEKLVPEPF